MHENRFPTRTREEQLADRSARRLADLFEGRFVVRFERTPDLGLDGSLDLMQQSSRTSAALNLRAFFQLKATAKQQRRIDCMTLKGVKTSNINYLGNQQPALYIGYLNSLDRFYYIWWSELIETLDRRRPLWRTQQTVSFTLAHAVNEQTATVIETEILRHHRGVRSLRDAVYYRRGFRGADLPGPLALLEPFVGRGQEIAFLSSQITQGAIVPIVGQTNAGKTQLVGHALAGDAGYRRLAVSLGNELGLLVIDPTPRLGRRFLRALAYAIGEAKAISLTDVESDPSRQAQQVKAHLLGEALPFLAQGLALIAVIENWNLCGTDTQEAADLDEFLGCDSLRTGTALILHRGGSIPDGQGRRKVQISVNVGPLSQEDAECLLALRLREPTLASTTVARAEVPKAFLPGVLRRGADEFVRRRGEGEIEGTEKELADLLQTAAGAVFGHFLDDLGCSFPDEGSGADRAQGSRATLLILSLLQALGVTEALLSAAGLPAIPKAALQRHGWLETQGDQLRLVGPALTYLREELATTLAVGGAQEIEEGAIRLLDLIQATEAEHDNFSAAAEECLAWIRDECVGELRISSRLLEILIPASLDDFIFPLDERDISAWRAGGPGGAGTHRQVADLALAVRFGAHAPETASLLGNVALSIQQGFEISSDELRSVDTAAHMMLKNGGQPGAILNARLSAAEPLERRGRSTDSSELRKWILSWHLNAADLAFMMGQMDLARSLSSASTRLWDEASAVHGELLETDWLWIATRNALLAASLEHETTHRNKLLQRAANFARTAFVQSGGRIRWAHFYQRSIRRLLEETADDDQREATVTDVLTVLTSQYGETPKWPIRVLAQAAAMMRELGIQSTNNERRKRAMRLSISMLQSDLERVRHAARLGDGRPMLVLARNWAALGSLEDELTEKTEPNALKTALRLASEATRYAPSSDAYSLLLRLTDQVSVMRLGGTDGGLPDSLRPIDPELRRRLKECRDWLKRGKRFSLKDIRLSLWCMQREWQAEGSLARIAEDSDLDWQTRPQKEKIRLVTELYQARVRKLARLRPHAGDCIDWFLLRAQAETQFRRLVALYSNHVVDPGSVLDILNEGQKTWSNHLELLLAEARFYRYIWDYGEAVARFRRVITVMTNGTERRRVMTEFARVLISAATHCDSISLPDGSSLTKEALFEEARDQVERSVGFANVARDLAILRDRLDLEAGRGIDWTPFDRVFSLVIGDVDDFLITIMEHLGELKDLQPTVPQGLAEAVLANFTSAELLGEMGMLYLRHAELSSVRPVEDYRRAYAIFQACRILERGLTGSETMTTLYRRARAILNAAELCGKADPFAAFAEGKASLLDLASALFQRLTNSAVGLFHIEARRKASTSAKLINTFRRTILGPSLR